MKKVSLIILMLALLSTACSKNNQGANFNVDKDGSSNKTNENEEELVTEKIIENTEIEIEKIEYFTGEIITDGKYKTLDGVYGSICFVPDMESRKLIEEKYDKNKVVFLKNESYFLFYDNFSILENLPKELGIFKVKVKIELKNIHNYNRFIINDIQLTNHIGTV